MGLIPSKLSEFVEKYVKGVFHVFKTIKKASLLIFSPFDFLRVLWWMGKCIEQLGGAKQNHQQLQKGYWFVSFSTQVKEALFSLHRCMYLSGHTLSGSSSPISKILHSTNLNTALIQIHTNGKFPFTYANHCSICNCPAVQHEQRFVPMDSMAEEICAQNEINPVWNQESSVVPQGSPQRTSVMVSISSHCSRGNVCMCLYEKTCPSNTTRHDTSTLTVHSNYLTSHSMTFQLLAQANKSPQRSERMWTKEKFSFLLLHTFVLFDNPVQSRCLEVPLYFNLDKVKASCLSVAY